MVAGTHFLNGVVRTWDSASCHLGDVQQPSLDGANVADRTLRIGACRGHGAGDEAFYLAQKASHAAAVLLLLLLPCI